MSDDNRSFIRRPRGMPLMNAQRVPTRGGDKSPYVPPSTARANANRMVVVDESDSEDETDDESVSADYARVFNLPSEAPMTQEDIRALLTAAKRGLETDYTPRTRRSTETFERSVILSRNPLVLSGDTDGGADDESEDNSNMDLASENSILLCESENGHTDLWFPNAQNSVHDVLLMLMLARRDLQLSDSMIPTTNWWPEDRPDPDTILYLDQRSHFEFQSARREDLVRVCRKPSFFMLDADLVQTSIINAAITEEMVRYHERNLTAVNLLEVLVCVHLPGGLPFVATFTVLFQTVFRQTVSWLFNSDYHLSFDEAFCETIKRHVSMCIPTLTESIRATGRLFYKNQEIGRSNLVGVQVGTRKHAFLSRPLVLFVGDATLAPDNQGVFQSEFGQDMPPRDNARFMEGLRHVNRQHLGRSDIGAPDLIVLSPMAFRLIGVDGRFPGRKSVYLVEPMPTVRTFGIPYQFSYQMIMIPHHRVLRAPRSRV